MTPLSESGAIAEAEIMAYERSPTCYSPTGWNAASRFLVQLAIGREELMSIIRPVDYIHTY